MSRTPLELPVGIRIWNDELRRGRRHLVEGYSFEPLEGTTDSFRFTLAAAPEKIPGIMRELCAAGQAEEAFLILEYYPDEQSMATGDANSPPVSPDVFYSPYLSIDEIFAGIDPYLLRLLHDGFVGFGLANNRLGLEIFFSEEKTLTCFTDNHIRVTNLMHRLGLPHIPDTTFHMDLGHDHYSLLCHPRHQLPEPLAQMDKNDLDSIRFCGELVDQFGMYPVEETLAFFLTRREQDSIEAALKQHDEYDDFASEDFGATLLDWNDFVSECETGFEGDLDDYRLGLHLRDIIAYVIDHVDSALARKMRDIVAEPDERFQQLLTDRRKRFDRPAASEAPPPFWYQGMVEKPGVTLRRDLIRQGWFKPHP